MPVGALGMPRNIRSLLPEPATHTCTPSLKPNRRPVFAPLARVPLLWLAPTPLVSAYIEYLGLRSSLSPTLARS